MTSEALVTIRKSTSKYIKGMDMVFFFNIVVKQI